MFVSLSPIILSLESFTSTQFLILERGDLPVPEGSYFSTSGNNNGNSDSSKAVGLLSI